MYNVLWLKNVKNTVPWRYTNSDLNVEEINPTIQNNTNKTDKNILE